MSTSRPVPRLLPETEPFWTALGRHQLLLQECGDCGRAQYYPRLLCRHCQSRALRWIEAAPHGTVYSFSVVHRAPSEFAADLPFITAVIELDAGPRVFTRLVDVAPGDVRIGDRVTASWATAATDAPLLNFRPEDRRDG